MTVRKAREEWKIYGNVFDQFTNETLFKLASQGYFDQLKTAVALGKEANIFSATPGREAERPEHVIVKIYRLENANFKKMYDYLRHDPRTMNIKPGKRTVIFTWCQREFRNLLAAREAIRVPTPLGFRNNVLVMGLIGDAEQGLVAPQLKSAPPEDPAAFSRKVLDNIAALWKAGLVHGDLSAFNILNHDEEPVFIDFSQASPSTAPNARELLQRDLANIASYFEKQGVKVDAEAEKARILAQSA